jgi:hypothetical protein
MSHAGTASSSGNTAVLRPACLARLGRRAKPGVRMACYSVALTPCLSPAHLPVRSSERDPHSPLHSPPPLRSLSAARRACTHEREARVAAGEERLLLRSVSPHDSFGGRRHPGDDKREQVSIPYVREVFYDCVCVCVCVCVCCVTFLLLGRRCLMYIMYI